MLVMGLIVQKIQGLPSHIHLHYLAFQRQEFWYPFWQCLKVYLWFFVLAWCLCNVAYFGFLYCLVLCRAVPDNCFSVCRGQWKRIPSRLILRKSFWLGRSSTTGGVRFVFEVQVRCLFADPNTLVEIWSVLLIPPL